MITEKVATELKGSVRGDVILPNDGRYDDARKVYNAMIDKRPAVVVRCTGVADVIAAVKAARAEGLAVAIRGGGHSVPGFGTADDALVIDLGRMRGIRVDPACGRGRSRARRPRCRNPARCGHPHGWRRPSPQRELP